VKAIGQEYTRSLREVTKVLEASLQAGLPPFDNEQVIGLRWEAIQRLSAICEYACMCVYVYVYMCVCIYIYASI
jgi:hypothetical protein